MAFITKGARKIDFSLSTGTGINVSPGAYDLRMEKLYSSNCNPFNSSVKRDVIEKIDHDLEDVDQVVRARNNFEYESEIIKHYLRKPLPNASFDSRSHRIPCKKSTSIPDPGHYYEDPMTKNVAKIMNAGSYLQKNLEKNKFLDANKDKMFRNQNKPSIPGKNEQFGYTYCKTDDNSMIRNFNPDMMSGDIRHKSLCAGPGEYDPRYNQISKAQNA